jgi:protein-arginine kinase activator protein McsA
MERKRTMAFSNSHRTAPATALTSSNGKTAGSPACQNRGYAEGGHQLEKLEFALAVAITRGDQQRVAQLRDQIDALGGNREEPGT